jgi:hypothetical protein
MWIILLIYIATQCMAMWSMSIKYENEIVIRSISSQETTRSLPTMTKFQESHPKRKRKKKKICRVILILDILSLERAKITFPLSLS